MMVFTDPVQWHSDGRRLVTSHDRGEAESLVGQFLWPHNMRRLGNRPGEMQTELSGLFLGDAAVLKLFYGDAVAVDAGEISKYFLVQTTLGGTGRIRNGNRVSDTVAGVTTVVSPTRETFIETASTCERLIVRITRHAIESQLAGLLHRELREPLVFDLAMEHDHPHSRVWLQALRYIDRQYRNSAPFLNLDQIRKHHSALLISLLLQGHRHNYSACLADDRGCVSPRHVRCAQEYIEQHLEEPITLSDMARETAVTARTLQNGFRRFLHCSPMEYVRARRLERIHDELAAADASVTVTVVLTRYGIGNFGRFARCYQRRYGCLPSETLRNGATA